MPVGVERMIGNPSSIARIRATATILMTNPDMVHVGILPGHEHWAEFLHHLRFVVLDEAHVAWLVRSCVLPSE